jgi:RNA polymerase sigma-70 factor (ECF subfamily)
MTAPARRVEEARLDAGVLFARHARFVAEFLWNLGIARQEIEDLLQEVFMVAHRKGGFAPGAAKATTWLAEIALRVAGTRRRGWARRGDVADDRAVALAVAGHPSPAERVEAMEALERVQRALDALDLGLRAVFVLYELQGESCDDIAQALGVPVGTVYSRLHEARRRVMAAHERQIGGHS